MTRYIALCKIVELGSFTRAADALGYTQAAVSQMIRSLEDEYRITFIVRSRSGIRLTPEGEALYPIIRSIVSSCSLLSEKAAEISSPESGEIKIGASSALAHYVIPSLLKKFSAKHPGIRFTLKTGEKNTLREMLLHGEILAALGHEIEGHPLVCETLAQDRLCAVFPPYHRLASSSKVSPDDLAGETLIVNENLSENTDSLPDWQSGLRFVSYDVSACLEMAVNDVGVAVLPASALKNTALPLSYAVIEPCVKLSVVLACKNDYPAPPVYEKFLSFIRENTEQYFI